MTFLAGHESHRDYKILRCKNCETGRGGLELHLVEERKAMKKLVGSTLNLINSFRAYLDIAIVIEDQTVLKKTETKGICIMRLNYDYDTNVLC
ncbi:hypothetical protein CHS0354_020277 [Potamilus streckersoni]|uniref:Uncharacterized protein n=1 Tax=Potamilus streckersoni TaxID=2493646 RepID=A0AAE0S5J8_9BIVA|nr:hypothetical protein CHS0354_020277 [Potamilus streckersoni]